LAVQQTFKSDIVETPDISISSVWSESAEQTVQSPFVQIPESLATTANAATALKRSYSLASISSPNLSLNSAQEDCSFPTQSKASALEDSSLISEFSRPECTISESSSLVVGSVSGRTSSSGLVISDVRSTKGARKPSKVVGSNPNKEKLSKRKLNEILALSKKSKKNESINDSAQISGISENLKIYYESLFMD
jgi:hypothetical protein